METRSSCGRRGRSQWRNTAPIRFCPRIRPLTVNSEGGARFFDRYDEWSEEYLWQVGLKVRGAPTQPKPGSCSAPQAIAQCSPVQPAADPPSVLGLRQGIIVDLDPDDATVRVFYGKKDEMPEIVEEEVEAEPEEPKAVTFETAPIKHIKDKTLKAFQKKYKKVAMFFYRPPQLCGHCPAVKVPFARVADFGAPHFPIQISKAAQV